MNTMICKVCGKTVEKKSNAQKYCIACKPKNYNKKANTKTVKNKRTSKQSLSEVNRLARESGMTYGQYVASLNR